MARLLIKFGASPDDKTGDSARTGAQKINTNFRELFEFLAGDGKGEVLPAAVPVSRGGTGATTAEGARQALGIGDGATKDVGTEEGDLIAVGSFGLGTDLSPLIIDERERPASSYKSGERAYVLHDDVSHTTFGTRSSDSKGQLGIKGVTTGKPVAVLRGTQADAQFSKWYELYSGAQVIVTVNGDLKRCDNSMRLSNYDAVSQHHEELVFTRRGTGQYTVQGVNLERDPWTKVVPLDEDGVPMYKVTIVENGTALDIDVMQGDALVDIPDGLWIDVNLKA